MAESYTYLLTSWLNNRGECQCGWTGKRRLLRGSAVVDVLTHCNDTSHVPLGVPPMRRVAQAL